MRYLTYTPQECRFGKSRWTFRKKLRLVGDTLMESTPIFLTGWLVLGAMLLAGGCGGLLTAAVRWLGGQPLENWWAWSLGGAFLDGRDTPPRSALAFCSRSARPVPRLRDAQIASICGRYYAMDRDKRWERVAPAYDSWSTATGERAGDAEAGARRRLRARRSDDEFVRPTAHRRRRTACSDGDGVLMFNFRADRAREI